MARTAERESPIAHKSPSSRVRCITDRDKLLTTPMIAIRTEKPRSTLSRAPGQVVWKCRKDVGYICGCRWRPAAVLKQESIGLLEPDARATALVRPWLWLAMATEWLASAAEEPRG